MLIYDFGIESWWRQSGFLLLTEDSVLGIKFDWDSFHSDAGGEGRCCRPSSFAAVFECHRQIWDKAGEGSSWGWCGCMVFCSKCLWSRSNKLVFSHVLFDTKQLASLHLSHFNIGNYRNVTNSPDTVVVSERIRNEEAGALGVLSCSSPPLVTLL